MSHDRLQPADTLVMPGIQDTERDWEALQRELQDSIQLHFSTPIDSQARTLEDIHAEKIEIATQIATGNKVKLVITHSNGGFDAIELLHSNVIDSIQGVLIICPPSNRIDKSKLSLKDGVRDKTDIQTMMRPATFDMKDDVFELFCDRHDANYNANTAQIIEQYKFLRDRTPFTNVLCEYNADIPIRILYSKEDPWNPLDPKNLPEHPNISYHQLPEGTGHYPHVSKANEVAAAILRFCSEKRIDLHAALARTVS